MTYPPLAVRLALIAVTVAAAWFDIRSRRIPTWLSIVGAAAAFCLSAADSGLAGLLSSAKGLAVALLIYFLLFALRAVGAGDVKLMSAVGALVGPMNWIAVFAFTAVLGGIFAIVLALSRGALAKTLANVATLLSSLAHGRLPYEHNPELDVRNPTALRLPHGAVIALGAGAFLAAGALGAFP